MCDVGRNEAPIGHQVHHNRIPHIPANKTCFLFIYITNDRLMTCSYMSYKHICMYRLLGRICCAVASYN